MSTRTEHGGWDGCGCGCNSDPGIEHQHNCTEACAYHPKSANQNLPNGDAAEKGWLAVGFCVVAISYRRIRPQNQCLFPNTFANPPIPIE